MVLNGVAKLLSRGLGIDPDRHKRLMPENLIQCSTEKISPFQPFIEELPSSKVQSSKILSCQKNCAISSYFSSLFPVIKWIRRYNVRWLMADAIAGFTLALIMIPQGLSYAILANLSPEYGLYTTLSGALLYWMFGTSKDVAVGATAVISLLVGKSSANIIEKHPQFTKEEVAKTHAFLAGCIFLFLGILRLGSILEFIPHVATSAFVVAAAITIICGQIPPLLGISGINTRGPAYQVFIDTCKGLSRTNIDAAIVFTALALLALIKWFCEYMTTRQNHAERTPTGNQADIHRQKRGKIWSTVSCLRFLLTTSIYILISFLVNRNFSSKDVKFEILGRIPTGFNHVGPPTFQLDLITAVLPELPAAVIIIIIEHVAIAKSFGRQNSYSISPSQELVAIASTNIAGPFIGAYASTASFGGSAVFSKAGVRTPLGGIFNAAIIILTLFVLQPVLYWIPKATLAALIIHAVSNLIEPPAHVYRLWLISPPDVIIYFAGVLVSIFTSLENGIYLTIAASAILLLIRISAARGRFLGRVKVRNYSKSPERAPAAPSPLSTPPSASEQGMSMQPRDVFLPFDRNDACNPSVYVELSCPGIFIYRFPDGFNYVNQTQHMDMILAHMTKQTRRTEETQYERPSASKPTLKAVILDFSTVNITDTCAMDGLVELRAQLQRWAKPGIVEWHFANVENRWVREELEESRSWNPIFTLAERKESRRNGNSSLGESTTITRAGLSASDMERGNAGIEKIALERRLISTHGINYPNFHLDLAAAVEAVKGFDA
ncbi:sulfate permease II [Annulohypoxylon nitens]|nr:sulfate permease II [Annulohypoxylon nitens]